MANKVVKKRTRLDDRREQMQDAFIAAYTKNLGNVRKACAESSVAHSTYYDWLQREDNDKFQKRLKEAKKEWRDTLFAYGFKRAAEKSDVLLMFFLKALEPEFFDDNLRKIKYLQDNKLDLNFGEAMPKIVLVRDDDSARPIVNGHVNGNGHVDQSSD